MFLQALINIKEDTVFTVNAAGEIKEVCIIRYGV